MKKYLFSLLLFWVIAAGNVLAQQPDLVKNDVITSTYYDCMQGSEQATGGDASTIIRYKKKCSCFSEEFGRSLSVQSIINIKTGKEKLSEDLVRDLVNMCKENHENYLEEPRINRGLLNKETNKSYIFSGNRYRFTAYKEDAIQGADLRVVSSVEYRNGQSLYDIEINLSRTINYLHEASTGKRYEIMQLTETTDLARSKGYDFTFMIPEINGLLFINSKNNTFSTMIANPENGTAAFRYYVRSQALICTALKEVKSRMIGDVAFSIFKEILLVAIRSYAGTSYSGGTFTGYTTNGNSVSGTYTRYDNSWLGEHYSRGLDSIFNGAGSISQVNAEMDRLECQYF